MGIPEKDLNVNLTFLIWDIMGQATFRTLLKDSYFFGASGALAVCDSTRPETLESLEEWVQSLFKTVGDKPILILANKSDLKDERRIDEEMLSKIANKYKTSFYYTSARSGENVEQAFYDLGRLILK